MANAFSPGHRAGEPVVTDKIPAKFHDEINDFARHCIKPLFRRLLLLTRGDHALADDLVQEVLEVMEQLCQQAEPTGPA